MITLNTLKRYVEAVKKQEQFNNELNTLFQRFDSDNNWLSGNTNEYLIAVDAIIKEAIGDNRYEYLMWWMYECDYGSKNAEVSWNDAATGKPITVDLTNFDAFYYFLIYSVEA